MTSESTPLPPPTSAPPLSSKGGAANKLLALCLCVLAFLLASTPANNSDLWRHLASGRWLSSGRFRAYLGANPFSSNTQGVFWVDHTWLSDFLLFQLYKRGDGAALVVGKAVLTALLAALWFCFRRRGEEMGVIALAGLAAILTLAPWLVLQPILLSLLGVVLTLYLLERPSLLEGAAAERARAARWLLVPMFALWANLDGWFVLGPILVGLYAMGELLRRSLGSRSVSEGTSTRAYATGSVLLFCAGLAACLATPYHYRIFAWPTPLGLTHTEQALQHDPHGQNLVLSPFAAPFAALPVFRSPGAWAYYFLLAASAASFVLTIRTLHPGRLLVCLALAALSIYQARTIPFFAVAAAPLLALNVQEWSRNHPMFLRSLAFPTRWAGVIVGTILLVLAWPGWLQPAPYQPRGWTIVPDESLVRMAERVKRWHKEGRLPSDRFVLTFSPEAAHHLAWFCPREKGFVDSRWPLFEGVADDYVRMRRCLLQEGGADSELASLLDAHHIDRILLHDSDWRRTARAYRHLFSAKPDWELLAVEGGATLFRRAGGVSPLFAPATGGLHPPLAFDFRRAAYHPTLDRCAPPAPPPPQAPRWFDAFRRRFPSRSADQEEAALYLLSFDLHHARLVRQGVLVQAAGLIGCGEGREATTTASTLAVRLTLTPLLPSAYHDEPLLLAVRAARRALAGNPQDAAAFLRLGQAYFQLARASRETSWQAMLPKLAELRRAQMLTALEQAVRFRPDFDQAHALLAQLYVEPSELMEMGQLDRCLDHLRARLHLAEQAVQRGGPEAEAAAQRRAALRADVARMQELVERSQKIYQANLAGLTDPSKVLERAQLAVRYGLSAKALEMLQESYPAIFGNAGVEYQLDLMMQAGQSYDVLEVLKPKDQKPIDFFKYPRLEWFKVAAAASCGDYAEADAELERGSVSLRRLGLSPKLVAPVRSAVAFHVARAVLTRPPRAAGAAGLSSALRFQFEGLYRLELPAKMLRQEADRQVLRGLLALEAGTVEKAGRHFRAALDVWGSESAAATGAGLDFPARPIAQQMLRQLQDDKVTR